MKSFRFRDSKLIERWEIIDIFSVPKELAMRQMLSAIKNPKLEYGEVRTSRKSKSLSRVSMHSLFVLLLFDPTLACSRG
jgi:hypothetical protein